MAKRNLDELLRLIASSRKVPAKSIVEADVGGLMSILPKQVHWKPDIVLKDTGTGKCIAFSLVYGADSVPTVLIEQVEKAKRAHGFEFFFLLEDDGQLDGFAEACSDGGFGLVVRQRGVLRLARDAVPPIKVLELADKHAGHFPQWVLDKVVTVGLGNSRFKTALKDFVFAHRKLIRAGAHDPVRMEEKLVRDFIARLLGSDDRFSKGIGALVMLRRFESSFGVIRDHYFHSCQILLLGLIILDRYREEFMAYFRTVFPKYNGLSLEFAWLLTALFHDVGYPAARLDNYKQEVYGTSKVAPEREVANVWAEPAYEENLRQLTSLLRFAADTKRHRRDWEPDAFPRSESKIELSIREEFYSSHGVAGAFRLMNDIVAEVRTESDDDKRVFWAKHIYVAALSIALHDREFRKTLALNGVRRLKLSRFPFAALLAYLDSIQEDARDVYLCPDKPEFLEGFDYNGRVVARVNEGLASGMERLPKLRIECQDFKASFDCDGLKFEYPAILSAGNGG